jgi:hypothetical protein
MDRGMMDFEVMLSHLTDFPDKKIIFDITQYAEINILNGGQIANIIIGRIVSPATNLTYKLPTFYLIDSIMKHVGGPYAALFSRHLGEVFARAYDEVK